MSVAKVIVERIAVAELAVVVEETAIAGVVQFVIKKLAVIFVCWCGQRLRLICRRACDGWDAGNEKQADKEQSYAFHRLRRFGYISHGRADPGGSGRKNS